LPYTYIADNLARVREKMKAAALRANRPAADLVAVTKGATDDEVRALFSLGVDRFGENRAELFLRRAYIAAEFKHDIEAHFIGTLQRNKVRQIADDVSLIHSLDSIPLAKEIEKQAAKRDIRIPVLLEINSGREENKSGISPDDVFAVADEVRLLPHVSLRGVMTMAPNCEKNEDYRRFFSETRRAFERLSEEGAFDTDAPILSMGMSGSYEIAIEEGATLVRIGTTLFKK